MKYYVTLKVDARYVVCIDANDAEDAKGKAEAEFEDADLGELTECIDAEPIIVEDEDGNFVWEA